MRGARVVRVSRDVRAVVPAELLERITAGPEPDEFCCWRCGRPGRISAGRPVSVVALCGPGDVAIGLTHGRCSDSRIADMPDGRPATTSVGDLGVMVGQLAARTAPDGSGPWPRAVTVLEPRIACFARPVGQAEVVDAWVRELLGAGFSLVTDPLAIVELLPVPSWEARWADAARTALAVTVVLWEGERGTWRMIELQPEWSELVAADGAFGLLFGSLVGLEGVTVERIDEVIGRGQMVGGTIPLRPVAAGRTRPRRRGRRRSVTRRCAPSGG